MAHDDEDLAPKPKIYRYDAPTAEPEFAVGDADLIEEVTRHLETHIGPVARAFHEVVSVYVHVDVHLVPATVERPFHVLVTSGMSAKPMLTPPELTADWRHAELVMCLPSDWPLAERDFQDERHYWPIRWMKSLARFPHQYGSWLGYGHTIPNGDPAEPFASDTKFSGMLLVPPSILSDELHILRRADGTVIRFWSLLPLYTEEMDLKLSKGTDRLLELLDEVGVTEVIDKDRPNVAARRGWWPF